MRVRELFCHGDDFCQTFEPVWHAQCLASGSKRRNRARERALSEIMTILILFHQSHYHAFNAVYTEHICADLRSEFPHLVSSTRFVAFFPSALVPLCVPAYLPRRVDGRVVCRLDPAGRLPQSVHPAASGLPWPCRTGQDLGRLVLWLQAARGLQ